MLHILISFQSFVSCSYDVFSFSRGLFDHFMYNIHIRTVSQSSKSSSSYGWALFLVPVSAFVAAEGMNLDNLKLEGDSGVQPTTTDLSFKSPQNKTCPGRKKSSYNKLSLHTKCLPCLRVKPWNDRAWSACGTGRTCQRRSQRQGMSHFGWLQRHGKDGSGLKQHHTNYFCHYIILLSPRACSCTVLLHFSAAYFFFSEGFTIFWSFQGMEGANCIGYCTCVPVLAGLLLNRQSYCADADISFNMLHVSSCALAFHLFSQNKLRWPKGSTSWLGVVGSTKWLFVVQKITNRLRFSCTNRKSWCNYCCHAESAIACNPAVCCAAMQISNWKLRSEPKRTHDKCKFLSYKYFRSTQWMCLDKLSWQPGETWNCLLASKTQKTSDQHYEKAADPLDHATSGECLSSQSSWRSIQLITSLFSWPTASSKI